jgi:hypothetical protein
MFIKTGKSMLFKKGFRFLLMIIFLGISVQVNSQIGRFKAAYIFNFTRYVDWPDSYNKSEFVIGVYGSDKEVISEIKKISESKTVEGKSIKVIGINGMDQMIPCNILFVSKDKSGELKSIIQKTSNDYVLLVSDKEGTIEDGSAINFIMNSNKLAFEIKTSNAESKGLKVSNTLVNLALNKY